jgi:peptidoglycan/LPS O-acetylase OafA/YrhL
MTASQEPSEKIHSIQAARGVAALLVAAYHLSEVLARSDFYGTAPLRGFLHWGSAGVDFFFVLSGFIIFHVHRGDIDRPDRLARYFWKRITRIYPLFFVVMLLVGAKAALQSQFSWEYFLKTIFLVPQPPYPMMIQSWTLVQELIFYVLFGIAILNRRIGSVCFTGWLGLVVVGLIRPAPSVSTGFVDDLSIALTSPYSLLFVFGMFIAQFAPQLRRNLTSSSIWMGILFFVALGLAQNIGAFEGRSGLRIVCFGVASSLTLAGMVSAKPWVSRRLRTVADSLGSISYPLYLIHGAVISITTSALKSFGLLGSPSWLVLLLCLALAVLVAHLLHRAVEQPLTSALREFAVLRVKVGRA